MIDPRALRREQLLTRAAQEAREVVITESSLQGREQVQGWAFDQARTHPEDALFARRRPDGDYDLQASIVDAGTYLADRPAVLEMAARMINPPRQAGRRYVVQRVLNEKFALAEDALRPVLVFSARVTESGELRDSEVFKAKIKARRRTFNQADAILGDADYADHRSLLDLQEVTRRLARARRRSTSDRTEVDSENAAAFHEPVTAYQMVEEAMVAAGAIAAQYASGEIPLMYRVHALHRRVAAMIHPPELRQHFTSAVYSLDPKGHMGINRPYAPVSAPLRKVADLANHINLAAVVAGQEPPLSDSRLNDYIKRYGRQTEYHQAFGRTPEMFRGINGSDVLPSAAQIGHKLAAGTATIRDIADILFGKVRGRLEVVVPTRVRAADYVAAHPQIAQDVLLQALYRRQLMIRPSDMPAPSGMAIVDVIKPKSNEHYSLVVDQAPFPQAVAIAELCGRVAGVGVTVEMPDRLRPENEPLYKSEPYLSELARQGRLKYETTTYVDGGGVVVAATITLADGRTAKCSAGASDRDSAAQKAAAKAITKLDLINNPPTEKILGDAPPIHRIGKRR